MMFNLFNKKTSHYNNQTDYNIDDFSMTVDSLPGMDTGPFIPSFSLDDLPEHTAYRGQQSFNNWEYQINDGEKFPGGMGPIQILFNDYWGLRQRSKELFNQNLYAYGIIDRLVTNEIGKGLHPECSPEEKVIGVAESSLDEWSDDVETRFEIYGNDHKVCDWFKLDTFDTIQRRARMMSLIEGDVLVVLKMNRAVGLPSVALIGGEKVQTPLGGENNIRKGHEIVHGVEFDTRKRQVAYWVRQSDGKYERLPAYGEKSGRRISWLLYGTDQLIDDVRGKPLLSLVLQSLKEIDRYRDSAQRKAVINSILAMFIKKSSDKPGSLPLQNGAAARGSIDSPGGDGRPRKFNISGYVPGLIIDELQEGEEPQGFQSHGTDEKFSDFEEAIIQAVAWSLGLPPEILRLSFSSNYSASQAAINEFKMKIDLVWGSFSKNFNQIIYQEWLINETLNQRIDAPGLLDAWRDPAQYDIFGAWMSVQWYGSVKPSTDLFKSGKGYNMSVNNGWITNAKAARELHGVKFDRNVKKLAHENQKLAEAMAPIIQMKEQLSGTSNDTVEQAVDDLIIEMTERNGTLD